MASDVKSVEKPKSSSAAAVTTTTTTTTTRSQCLLLIFLEFCFWFQGSINLDRICLVCLGDDSGISLFPV